MSRRKSDLCMIRIAFLDADARGDAATVTRLKSLPLSASQAAVVFAPNVPATYDEARAAYDVLSAELAAASEAWRAIPGTGTGAMGLTPDAIKFGPEYQAARQRYNAAHAAMRDFNAIYQKRFKHELRADRDARRAALLTR